MVSHPEHPLGKNSLMSQLSVIPRFEPHPLARGGHAQTVLGRLIGSKAPALSACPHWIELEDQDKLSVLLTTPATWTAGDPVAVLVHGLTGDAGSVYVARPALDFCRLGIRVARMNLRGAGAGFGHARGIYHSGRTEDLRAVLNWLAERSPGSPIAMVGFSLGGNLVLKLAAEAASDPVHGLDCVLSANPPVDLAAGSRKLSQGANRFYEWNFVRTLRAQVRRLHERFPELGPVDLSHVRSIHDFDDAYTAKRCGFASAAEYYEICSSAPRIKEIRIPGLVIHSADDPFIPPEPLLSVPFPSSLEFELVPHGGHLGYLSRSAWAGSRHWLDRRLAAWLVNHWRIGDRAFVDDQSLDSNLSLGESLTTGSHSR